MTHLGFEDFPVIVEDGFVEYMDGINQNASECNVTVLVTHSYRKAGYDLDGIIQIPPENERSPHLVGHAIDIILDTPGGICNSNCMINPLDANVICFVEKMDQLSINVKYGNMEI